MPPYEAWLAQVGSPPIVGADHAPGHFDRHGLHVEGNVGEFLGLSDLGRFADAYGRRTTGLLLGQGMIETAKRALQRTGS